MSKRITMSMQTRMNWLTDAAVFVGAVLASLSGIHFLFAPSGGYQGGRNLMYGVTVLFDRHAWDHVHTWGGVLMIAAVVIHFAIHWDWVKMMTKRIINAAQSKGSSLSKGAKFNVFIDALIGVSFLITALSGVYFLFTPTGGFQGGSNLAWDPGFLLSRTTWDMIHTWAGVVMIGAAVVHFAIHWRWVVNVSKRFFQSLWPQPESNPKLATKRA